jgi:hypothetical protein
MPEPRANLPFLVYVVSFVTSVGPFGIVLFVGVSVQSALAPGPGEPPGRLLPVAPVVAPFDGRV